PVLAFDLLFFPCHRDHRLLPSFPTRRSSDLALHRCFQEIAVPGADVQEPLAQAQTLKGADNVVIAAQRLAGAAADHGGHVLQVRSEEHTSELQSRENLVCRLLLEKKKA